MKRVIYSGSAFDPEYNNPTNFVDDEYWIPPMIDEAFVDDILNRIQVKCRELYQRRFPELSVEFDDEYWGSKSGSGGSMHVMVYLLNNHKEKASGEFKFHTQDFYWDESDYQQDINTSVHSFCENLV